ncbi:MAG: BamA/TamA family outer membrane protein [Terrimicrobiaceae bacterium]|nr:BamA/TamA family outer membrane protein [Terrimicrobiaceae bacterium]
MRGVLLAIAAWFGLWAPARPPAGDIHFQGNESFGSAQLLAILRNRYDIPLHGDFGVTDADDAAFFLRTFYFSRGYRAASVAYTFRPAHPPSVLFAIDEGGRNSIGGVSFDGASDLPPDRLREIFDAAVRQATLRPFGRMRYVESAVEAGRVAIVNALAQRGFLVAAATVSDSPASLPGLVDLRIRIDQGVCYFVRGVSFAGAPVDDAMLRGVLREYLDQPYQRNQEALMRTRVQDWLRNRGYLQAEVATTATLDPVSGKVTVVFDIAAGRTYKIGHIRVEGVRDTRVSAILSRFAVHPGTPYDASKVDAAARRLWFSGAFAEADVQRVPNADGTVDLLLKIEEAPAKRIQFGLGYSQWDRGYGQIHYIDRNFLGTLNRFSIDGELSQRSYGISTALTDPWLFGTDFEGSIGGAYARRELPAYRSTEASGTLTLARSYSSANLTGYRFQYGYKRVSDAEVFGEAPGGPVSDYTLGSLTFSQTYDTRNNILSPMKGLFLNHEIEVASPVLLGDISFLRLSAQVTYYLPLREITTEHPFIPFVIFNHRIGALLPFGDTNSVPVQERFFLGGPNTVRSFQLDGLGPRDRGGNPIGGLAMLLFNAEIQWPVFNNIYLAAFTDAGNLWSDVRDIQPTDLQVAVGPGMRIYTPLGAIRIDYGYNVNRQPGDPIGNWQVGFGFTF